MGLLKHLEEIPLFVEGVDRDITSDITTRIIFEPLADFTAKMLDEFPQFSSGTHRTRTYSNRVWGVETESWMDKSFTLPLVSGKPLLLVPRAWTRRNLLISGGQFYETTVLTFARLEQAVVTEKGKLLKDDLKRQDGLKRGRGTNLRVTMRALESDEDLVAYFHQFVASRFEIQSDGADAA